MFFISRIVFVRNAQNIYTLEHCCRMKEPFLQFTHFYMRIKKNCVSQKKNPFLYEVETTVEYLSTFLLIPTVLLSGLRIVELFNEL